MKLTKEMKAYSREWIDNLIHQTDFGTVQPTVPDNWEQGMWFGTREARDLLDKAETTEEWKLGIMEAISHRKLILMKDVLDDQKVINKAMIMGLKTALGYAECIELSGGMNC